MIESGHIPYEQRISYTIGALNEAESAVVAAHTATCDECNSTIVRLRAIRRLVRGDFLQDPPAATIARAKAIFRQAHTNHVPYEERISYAIGVLDETESAVVAAHTVTCDECNSTIVRLRAIRGLVRGDFLQDPPAATIARAQAIFRQVHTKSPPPQPTNPSWLEFFRTKGRSFASVGLAALLIALVLIFGQAVVASAAEAIPGDLLYPVKLNVEALQVMTAFGKDAQAHVYLDIARKRVDEIVALNEKRRYAYIASTLTAYEDATQQVVALVDKLSTQDADRAAVLGAETNDNISKQIAVLTALEATVPNQAKSAIAHAITVSKNGASTVKEKVEQGKKGKPAQTLTRTPPGKLVTPGVPPPKDDTPGPPGPPPSKTLEPSKTPNTPGPPPSKTLEPSKTPNTPGPPPSKTLEPSKTPNTPGPPPSKTPNTPERNK